MTSSTAPAQRPLIALMTVDEAAATLRVSRATVYRYIGAGELAAVRLRGQRGMLRIPSADVARLLREGAERLVEER